MEITNKGYLHKTNNWGVNGKKITTFSRVYYIKSGEVIYTENDSKKILTAGNLYIMPTAKLYSLSQTEENPVEKLWLHISAYPYRIDKLLTITPEPNSTLYFVLEALSAEMKENPDSNAIPTLFSVVESYILSTAQPKKLSPTMARSLAIIEDNLTNRDLNVNQLAYNLSLTPEHFIRTFKQELLTSPYQYVLARRMVLAQNLLVGGMSVTDVATAVGYGDVRTFSTAFKNKFNYSPSAAKNRLSSTDTNLI